MSFGGILSGVGGELARNPTHAIENGLFGGVGALAGFIGADMILGPIFEQVAPNTSLVEGFQVGQHVGMVGSLLFNFTAEARIAARAAAAIREATAGLDAAHTAAELERPVAEAALEACAHGACQTGKCFAAGTKVQGARGTVAIETVQVGDFVRAAEEERCTSPDGPRYRVDFEVLTQDDTATLSMLADEQWLHGEGRREVGDWEFVSLPELALFGLGRISAITPIVLEPMTGCVVSATIERTSKKLRALHLRGENGPLFVTDEHPFYSAHRGGFVAANELIVGESVVTDSGLAIVQGNDPGVPGQRVFNFEVEGSHTYYVGDSHALVHNNCSQVFRDTLNAMFDDRVFMGTFDSSRVGPHIIDRSGHVLGLGAASTGPMAGKSYFRTLAEFEHFTIEAIRESLDNIVRTAARTASEKGGTLFRYRSTTAAAATGTGVTQSRGVARGVEFRMSWHKTDTGVSFTLETAYPF